MMNAIPVHVVKFAVGLPLLVLLSVTTCTADDATSSHLTLRNTAGEEIAVLGSHESQTLTVQSTEGAAVILTLVKPYF